MKELFFILLFLFISIFDLKSQEQELYFSFKNSSAEELLNKVNEKSGVLINFNHDFLPTQKISSTFAGPQSALLPYLESLLEKRIVKIEKNVFALQNKAPAAISAKPIFEGWIKDREGFPLAFAIVQVKKAGLVIECDVDGYFTISAFLAGNEIFEISYLGYKTKYLKAYSLQGSPKEIFLEQQDHILGEILVKDFLKTNQYSEFGDSELMKTNSLPLTATSDGDLLDKTQLLPGVYNAGESLSDLQIRGGPPDQTGFKWNNIQTFQSSLFYGKVSAFNPFLSDEIRVTKNGAAASESGQASGELHFKSNSNLADSFSIRTFSNLMYSNIGVNLPLLKNKINIKAAYRKSYSSFFQSGYYQNLFSQTFQFGTLVNDEIFQDKFNLHDVVDLIPQTDFSDLSVVLSAQPGKNDLLKLSLLNFGNQMQYERKGIDVGIYSKEDLSISSNGLSLDYHKNWNSNFKSSIVYSKSKFVYEYLNIADMLNFETSRKRITDNDINLNQFKFAQNFQQNKWTLSAGIQYDHWAVNHLDSFFNVSNAGNYSRQYNETNELSLFSTFEFRPAPFFKASVGLRWSDYSHRFNREKIFRTQTSSIYYTGKATNRACTLWRISSRTEPSELATSFQVETGFWYLSDTRESNPVWIEIVENKQLSFGARYSIGNWSLNAEWYHKKIENMWTAALDFSIDEDPYSFGNMTVSGFEFAAQFRNKNLSLIWTYDYIDEKIELAENRIVNSPFSQPHRISLFQTYQLNRFAISAQWKYGTGRLYSNDPILDYWTNNAGREIPFVNFGRILEDRVSDYHVLDVSLLYQVDTLWKKGPKAKFGVHVQNLYNRGNIIKNLYHIDYTKDPQDISLLRKRGLPTTPNVSLELFF